MTITVEKLECARCGSEHDSVPPVRTDVWNGVEITGVWASDFTYVRDNYLSKGFVVLCKKHERDVISHKTDKDLHREISAGI